MQKDLDKEPEVLIEEERELIAKRKAPGDNWVLELDQGNIVEGLVMALTLYMRKTKFKGEYRLAPLEGKLYAIKKFEVEVEEVEPMKFDLYGEY
jgi:hypothetical protein|tara:strand:- start:50 stop:331 length:282 start_codon:yes stop_codon:yes gene_type:complete